MGEQWKQRWGLSSWAPKSLQMVTAAVKLKDAPPWKKSYDTPRPRIKKQRHCFANKGPSSQRYGFSSSHIWMWELDHKEGWAPKNYAFELYDVGINSWESFGQQRDQTSHPEELNLEYSLKGLMLKLKLKLKLQYFGHLMQRADSLETTLMLGKIEGRRRRAQPMMRWLDSIPKSMDMIEKL